jgi:hypothetical protein
VENRQLPFSALQTATGRDALEVEILAEKAASLGHAGRKVELTLRRLREAGPAADRHPELLAEAADAVWSFQVQRDLCGFRDWDRVVEEYRIPREVLVRLGRM